MKNILSIAALAAVISAGAAHAAPNLVNDGNFALDPVCCGPYGVNDPYWHNVGYYGGTLHGVYNNTQNLVNTTPSFTNAPGGKFYYSDGQPSYNSTYIYQTISGLTAGHQYKLTFKDAFLNENQGTVGNTIGWKVNFGGTNPAGGSFSFPTDGVTKTTALYLVDPTKGAGWFDEVMTFTATGATDDLAFKPLGTGFPPFALLTDVSLTGVPEPATWTMLLIGVAGLGALARRRRTAAPAA